VEAARDVWIAHQLLQALRLLGGHVGDLNAHPGLAARLGTDAMRDPARQREIAAVG
jgi:hypothetical protein